MATSMAIEPRYRHKTLDALVAIVGVFVLCVTFVVTHAELHGEAYPVLTAGMALWAISPLIIVNFAKRVADASVGRYFVLYLVILLVLLFPQFSLAFRDQQYLLKLKMGIYSDLYPVLVSLACSAIAFLLASVCHSFATWRVWALYSITIGLTVLSLFLIN